MIIKPDKYGDILSDSSKKLSLLDKTNSIGLSDYFIIDRQTNNIESNVVILNELSNDIKDLENIIALEGDDDEKLFLLNELKTTIDYIWFLNSQKISYNDFKRSLDLNISANLGTMAYEDKHSYSKIDHEHDYTYSDVKPIVQSGDLLAVFRISDLSTAKDISVYQPIFEPPLLKIYKIGEMALVAVTNMQVNIKSDDFDGWVYADGQRYNKDDFPGAYEVFTTNRNDTTFLVPLLSNFIKCTGNPVHDNLSKTQYNNVIAEHTHGDIDSLQFKSYKKSTDVTVKLKTNTGSASDSNASGMHTGWKNKDSELTNLRIEIKASNMQSYATKTNDISNQDIESKPSYIKVPMMVYIGKIGETL